MQRIKKRKLNSWGMATYPDITASLRSCCLQQKGREDCKSLERCGCGYLWPTSSTVRSILVFLGLPLLIFPSNGPSNSSLSMLLCLLMRLFFSLLLELCKAVRLPFFALLHFFSFQDIFIIFRYTHILNDCNFAIFLVVTVLRMMIPS